MSLLWLVIGHYIIFILAMKFNNKLENKREFSCCLVVAKELNLGLELVVTSLICVSNSNLFCCCYFSIMIV
jgi:hypothetical protein